MKFGIFLAPFHRVGENPTLALRRDLELVDHLDRLGLDEAWIGEHHSAARETIADPAVFIAAAAERTRRIMLGTGVVSLPYHHPLMVADKMVLLDHLTQGRAMLGVGPGALASDAYMLGIDPVTQRRRMHEALDAIMALLRADGPVDMETEWFTLRDARLQLASYTRPHLPVSVAAVATPSGATAAGRHGLGMLSVGGANHDGFAHTWEWAEEAAAEAGQTIDRDEWRVVVPLHLAETREQAIEEVREGYRRRPYLGDAGPSGNTYRFGQAFGAAGFEIEEGIEAGEGLIVGTPDDAIASIDGILERSGGLGGILVIHNEWASTEVTHRSFELLARYVAPHFQGQIEPLVANRDWFEEHLGDIFGPTAEAQKRAFTDLGREPPQASS